MAGRINGDKGLDALIRESLFEGEAPPPQVQAALRAKMRQKQQRAGWMIWLPAALGSIPTALFALLISRYWPGRWFSVLAAGCSAGMILCAWILAALAHRYEGQGKGGYVL